MRVVRSAAVAAALAVGLASSVTSAWAASPSAGLAVTITPATTEIRQAAPTSITITVTNKGPNTAPAANLDLVMEADPNTFHLVLPAQLKQTSHNPNQQLEANWSIGNLAVGQTVRATLTIIGQQITGANSTAVPGALILTATSKVANPLLQHDRAGDTWSTSRVFRTIRPLSRNPFGHLDSLGASGSSIRARGWAADPDNLFSPLPIALSDNGRFTGGMRHPISRPDVAQARGTGEKQGFDITLKVKPGRHQVCVYATSYGPGTSTKLGCGTVVTH